ncbi:FliI/YscN family ATPase [Oxalobacteraceae bacterium CAVE-383]|nr:FliI/YscN family ATPase [Oxalobacteraceae bacterium CAVE-383]
MDSMRLLRRYARPVRLRGSVMEAPLPGVAIGEICELRRNWEAREVAARAQVIGFKQDVAVLSLMGEARGLSRDAVLAPTGAPLRAAIGPAMLGAAVDPSGAVVERFDASAADAENASHASNATPAPAPAQLRAIDSKPPAYNERRSIDEPMVSGVRVIDGLLTCGVGQRVGIFSSAGCGKTTLMNMLISHAEADVFVIGLIGERGREVTEFVDMLRESGQGGRCVLVYATADFSPVERCNAALLATTAAEYFRDQGKRVVLFLDSITRYARALRDVALAAGEPPARRGYPASVFDVLPRVLERPGLTKAGSITAFYTILLESDDEPDPIADEIRSILDGHIYLSRKLAGQGHFPAIDVLRSTSRVTSQVCSPAHLEAANGVRGMMAQLEDLQMMLDLGEYRQGQNPDNDRAMARRDAMRDWARQPVQECSDFEDTLQAMQELAR